MGIWREDANCKGALAAEFVGDKLYAIGGFNTDGTYAIVEQYDPSTDSWEEKTSMLTAREHLASASVDGKLYAMGGFAKGIGNLAVNERYDPDTDSWEALQPMPTPRNGLTSSEINGVIFAFGGEDGQQAFSENEAYIPEEDTWYTLQSLPVQRQGLFSAAVENTIYVMGGGIAPGASYSSLNHAYQNNAIPEFEFVVFLIFGISLATVIVISQLKIKGKSSLISIR